MPQHRSQRGGGVAASGGSPGSTSADGGVRAELTDLILGNGPEALQYGRAFSEAASLRFFTQYAEYERRMELSNNAQFISRPVLSVSQPLRKFIRSCLSRTYFDGTDCRAMTSAMLLLSTRSVGRVVLSTAILRRQRYCRRVTIGSEVTAVDRTDAVQSHLEQYFENPSAEHVFRDASGAFKQGPAAVISKEFVAGFHPSEFKVKVESKLDMRDHWKDKQ